MGLLAIVVVVATLAGCQGMASPNDCPAGVCPCGMPLLAEAGGDCSAGTACGGYPEPEPEPVYPRFHPVPTRPVFAAVGYLDEATFASHSADEPVATAGERALEIEVLPPAPVPEEILNPTANPGPQDRMTQVPRRLVGKASDASWVFPVPTGSGSDRLVDRRNPSGPASGSFRR